MYEKLHSIINSWDLAGTTRLDKTVFLRADLNIPLDNGTILDDFRLRAILPTLDLLIKKKARIILATHIGRPTSFDAALSTSVLVPWFKKMGYAIAGPFAPQDITSIEQAEASIILLENLRFYPEEKKGDINFAKLLASYADFYVDDAFATIARSDTSITILPTLFAVNHRSIGLLVEKEIKELSRLRRPQHPLLMIFGGGKVHDKLPLIKDFLGLADQIALCPAPVFTFLAAQDKQVGLSLVDRERIEDARKIIQQAHSTKTQLLYPIDYLVAQDNWDGRCSYKSADQLAPNDMGIAIGKATINSWKSYINSAKTIFFNGPMGDPERPETLETLHELLQLIAASGAYTFVAGGDSDAMLKRFGLREKINYISTGGGAALAFLAHEKLPGLSKRFYKPDKILLDMYHVPDYNSYIII